MFLKWFIWHYIMQYGMAIYTKAHTMWNSFNESSDWILKIVDDSGNSFVRKVKKLCVCVEVYWMSECRKKISAIRSVTIVIHESSHWKTTSLSLCLAFTNARFSFNSSYGRHYNTHTRSFSLHVAVSKLYTNLVTDSRCLMNMFDIVYVSLSARELWTLNNLSQ